MDPGMDAAFRLPGAAGQRLRKDRSAGDCQRPKRSPSRSPGTIACLPAGPVWRTAAVAPDGLCRGPSPPARPEGYGERLSFSHRIFAASRLRVNP